MCARPPQNAARAGAQEKVCATKRRPRGATTRLVWTVMGCPYAACERAESRSARDVSLAFSWPRLGGGRKPAGAPSCDPKRIHHAARPHRCAAHSATSLIDRPTHTAQHTRRHTHAQQASKQWRACNGSRRSSPCAASRPSRSPRRRAITVGARRGCCCDRRAPGPNAESSRSVGRVIDLAKDGCARQLGLRGAGAARQLR